MKKNKKRRRTLKIKNMWKYLIIGLISSIYRLLEMFYDEISINIHRTSKVAKMTLFYTIIILSIIWMVGYLKTTKITFVKEVQAKEIKQEIKLQPKCNMDEISCLIKEEADKQEIDWKIAVSISRFETGNYTSKAFHNKNNMGGIMVWDGSKSTLKSYTSLNDGIKDFVRILKTYYFDEGLDTLEEIKHKYCPDGAANDPTGLNSNWLRGTTAVYKEL